MGKELRVANQPQSGGTCEAITMMFRPLAELDRVVLLIPWLAPWATDLSPLARLVHKLFPWAVPTQDRYANAVVLDSFAFQKPDR